MYNNIDPKLKLTLSLMIIVYTSIVLLCYSCSRTKERDGKEWEEYNKKGLHLAKDGEIEKAIEAFKRAVELNKEYMEARSNLAFSYMMVNKYDESEAEYKAIIKEHQDNIIAHNGLGVLYSKREWYDKSINEFLASIKIDPAFPDSYFNLAIAYYKKGSAEDAVKYFNKVLEIKPDHIDALFYLGLIHKKNKAFDKAVKYFNEVIKSNPNHIETLFNLAHIYKKQGDKDNSSVIYAKILEIEPNYIRDRLRGGDYYLGKGWIKEAIIEYAKVIEIEKENFDATFSIGKALQMGGFYDRSIEYFNKAIEYKPDLPITYYNIAASYAAKNEKDTALIWLKKAFNKGFFDYKILGNDPLIAGIREDKRFKALIEERHPSLSHQNP